IGVGQYQHDVSQKQLHHSLAFVVETTVNQVGVNVNTASVALLEYVSGLNKTVARNIIKQRQELGKFTDREALKDVPRLGPKTDEQAIGFLRVIDGDHPLDRTPIHPESYAHTEKVLEMVNCKLADIGTEKLKETLKFINLQEMASELGIGELTLKDIIDALNKPER